MRKRLLALTMMSALTVTAFAGCGSDKSNTQKPAGNAASAENPQAVSLKLWTSEEDYELTEDMCARFDEAHPEYKCDFEITIINVDESVEQLETDPDNAADVFIMPSGSIPQLVEEGLVYPITYDADTLKGLYSEGALDACSMNGELYGVPFTPNSWFMFYNKKLFNAEEVKSLETMMAKDLGDDTYNFSCSLSNSWYIEAWFYAAGCTLFGEDGITPDDCTWNNANGLAAGEYIIDLVNNPKYIEDKDGIAGSLMKEGKLGAICTGTWGYPELLEALGDDLGAVALPTVEIAGKTANLSNFADYKCFAVKSNTSAPLAAQQLAEFFANEENQLLRYQKNSTPPTALSLTDNADIMSDISTCALLAQTEFATPQPAISQINAYWTPAEALGTGIVNGEITKANLQESLDSLVQSVTTKAFE